MDYIGVVLGAWMNDSRGVDMLFQKAKLFWYMQNGERQICYIPFDDNCEYYDFLRKYHDKGYKQIIITSEFMSDLMRVFCQEQNLSVYEIDLMEDDEDLDAELKNILQQMESDRIYFERLLSEIKFLSEQSSIDINRIYFKGRYNGVAVRFFIQANGIIGVVPNFFNKVAGRIKAYLSEELF